MCVCACACKNVRVCVLVQPCVVWFPLVVRYRFVRFARTIHYIRIYGAHTVFLAGKSPYIRSYTVCIYGSGQPYRFGFS